MNKKIDLNELSFISYVANDLDSYLDDLISVNTIISDVGSFVEFQGLQYELGYSYSNQKKKLNTLSDDIKTFANAATTGGNYGHANNNSVEDILYACVEHPFYLSLNDTIERLSKVKIEEYEVDNPYGNSIVTLEENWNETRYRDYTRTLNPVTNDSIDINDILKSQYSRDRMRVYYELQLQSLYPNIEDFSTIDTDMFYDAYLASILTIADFDHTTLLENSMSILRTTGAVLALGTLFFTAIPGAATFLGVNVSGLSLASGIVNGGLSFVDVLCLFNGTDINGNPLTSKERDALMATVTVDAVFLSISVAGKIRYNASKTSDFDDWLKNMSLEDAEKYIKYRDLVDRGFTAEELYNLEAFGSIKTGLDYTTSTGIKINGTHGKTTTIIGNYNDDMQYIVDELGNIKSVDFGAKPGGLNILNVPDDEWALLGPDGFWDTYNAPWLQQAIDRGDVIKVATPITDKYIYRLDDFGNRILTGFGKEVEMLDKAGYIYDITTSSFYKP